MPAPDFETKLNDLEKAKKLLWDLQQKFSLATQAAQIGIWEYFPKVGNVVLDQTIIDIYGLPQNYDPTFEALFNYVHPDDYEALNISLLNAIETARAFNNEFRIIRPDGDIRFIKASGVVENDNYGNLNRIIGTNQDITSQVKSEWAIKESEAKFRSFFENSMDAIFLSRQDGSIISANPAACEIFGKSEAELCKGGRDSIVDRTDGKLSQLIELRNSTGRAKGDLVFLRQDGSRFPGEVTSSLFTDASGEKLISVIVRDISERLNAERQLKDSEVKYRSFFENSMDATLLTVQDGQVLAANPAACSMFGMTEAEICAAGREGLVDTADPALPRLIKERIETGKAKGELTFKRKDGTSFTGEISSSVFEAHDQKRTIMIIRDATERRKAEAELKLSNERYEIVSKATNDAVWDWNLTTNELWWGESFFTLFGYQKDSIAKSVDSWYSGLHPDDTEWVSQSIQLAIEKKQHSWSAEYRFSKADGQFLFVYDRGYLLYNEGGDPIRMIGSMVDITARRTAEENLKHSEEGYRQIVETAQEGIWLINDEDVTIFVNKKMGSILGYSVQEMMGRKSYDFMDEEWRKIDEEQTRKRASGKTENYEFKFLAKNGEGVWVSISTNSVFNEDGSYRGAMAMVTDITQRKQQEIELQKSTEEREMLISELVKSNYDLQQFSYITSHNFRAPMANLMALLDLIDQGSLTDENKAIIEMFHSSANQLNTTINDLVEILIVKSSSNLQMSENDMAAIYNEIYSTLLFQVADTGAKIECNFKVKTIYFHNTYLKSILMNLLTNAIRYRSPKRQLEVNISTRQDEAGNVLLSVSDNGLGINLQRHRDSLFGLYQKFHSNPESVGLGLYIVKSQITALGGSIDVESEVDKGTTFHVTFPPQRPAL